MTTRSIRLAFALLALLWAAPLASQQQQALHPQDGPYGTLGYTEWTQDQPKPLAWIRIDLLLEHPQKVVEGVIKHEMKHVEQMLRHGGTWQGWDTAIVTWGKNLHWEMEAEAYCVSAQVDLKYGEYPTLEDAIKAHAWNLTNPAYQFSRTYIEGVRAIEKYCAR